MIARRRGTTATVGVLVALAGCGGGTGTPAPSAPPAQTLPRATKEQGVRAFCVLGWNIERYNAPVRRALAASVRRGTTQVSLTTRKRRCTVTVAQNGRAVQYRASITGRRSRFRRLQERSVAVAALPGPAREFIVQATPDGTIALPGPK